MSFSSELKEEISKTENLANKQSVKYELLGYLLTTHTNIKNNEVKFSTENEYNINRFSRLLSNLKIEDYNISIQGKIFIITFYKNRLEQLENIDLNKILLEDIKWVIRGAFLGGGSVNNPKNKYHLELSIRQKENAEKLVEMLKAFDIKSNIMNKKNGYSIYLKDGEEISKFLALLGANKSVIKFEEIRVQREMNNKINRIVNCETANLNKTINASIEQIEAIKKLKRCKKFNQLEESLKEIANVRLENPNLSLIELGKKLKEPLGKSGVNYRLKKIMEIANGK